MVKALKFFYEIAAELQQVKWPSYRELVNYAIAVFVVVLFSTIIVGLIDLGFAFLMNFLLGWE